MTEGTPPEGPTPEQVDAAREALARPGDEEDADGTTRDAATEPDVAGSQPDAATEADVGGWQGDATNPTD